MNVIEMRISEIKVGDRCRKEMGDLKSLAQSISDEQLLQPIGITPDNELVFGERRLVACRDILGWETIPARIVDVSSVLLGQIDENVLRKSYTLTEQIAIVDSLGQFQHGGDRRSNHARNSQHGSFTLADACDLVGVSVDTYRSVKKIEENGTPELVAAVDTGTISVHAAETLAKASKEEQQECLSKPISERRATGRSIEKQLRRIRNRKERENDLAQTIEAPKTGDDILIHHCSFQNLESTAGIKKDSVQLICTDIPYEKSFLDQLDELGEFAKQILADGGIFVTYSGKYWLDKVIQTMGRHLTYRWMIASVWTGEASPIYFNGGDGSQTTIVSQWKPILIFSKGNFSVQGRWNDVSYLQGKEKDWHDWQQPLSDVEKLVQVFSKPGDLVIDPCGGGFTTAVACLKNHRRFVGCDVDQVAVTKGQERLALERRTRSTTLTTVERAACEEPNLSDWVPMAG
jgi:hypothetical protein